MNARALADLLKDVNLGSVISPLTTTTVKLPPGQQIDWGNLPLTGWVNDEQRAKWKEEGKCEECGTLLPMSIHGLCECPSHPAKLPEGFKQ